MFLGDQITSRDGTQRPIEYVAAPICDARGAHGAVLIFRDVSGRRKSEEALKAAAQEQHRQKQLLKRLIDNSPVAIALVKGPELRYEMVNPAYQTIAETPDSIIGKTHEQVFPKAAEEGSLRKLIRVLAKGEGWKVRNYEVRLRSRGRTWWDGEVLPLANEAGEIDSALILAWEITERKLAEQALHESEEKFRLLADNISQFAWIADPEGRIFWYNRRWFEYSGTSLSEMEGWGWQKVHHPDHVDRVVKKIRHCFETGTFWEDTFPLRGKDGKYRWFLSRAVPIFDREGKVVRWFGTNTDIDDQRKAEEALRYSEAREKAARQEAERAGRFKDEFLATLSHELRNPLNAVLGWTKLLCKYAQDQPRIMEGLDIIERNARAQAQLVSDLLDMNRIAAGKLHLNVAEVDLVRIVREAIETMHHAIDARRLQLELSLPTESVLLRADPDRLRQVVWNLLSNAVKFTPEEGRIGVTVEKELTRAIVTVTDTGHGIRADFLPRIFEKFQQSNLEDARKHGGLGLGLALVKRIVEMHGGEVSAESQGEGLGSTFRVQLPIHRHMPAIDDFTDPSGRNRAGELPCDFPELAGLKVLVVDNDVESRSFLARVLEECDAKVVTACDAAEAFKQIQHQCPDMLVCDIALPDEDGNDFLIRLRAQGFELPAVAVTAFGRPEDRMRSLQSGYLAQLVKPVEPNELLATVAAAHQQLLQKRSAGLQVRMD